MAFGIGRRLRPEPQSDMQMRLRVVEKTCKKVKDDPEATLREVALADSLIYLSVILDKHLRTNET